MEVLLVPGPAIAADVSGIVTALEAGGAQVRLCEAAAFPAAALEGIEVLAAPGSLRCDAALMDRAPDLRGLVAIGSGCEGFDLQAADARGVAVLRGATRENIVGMASAAVMLMLALAHDLNAAQAAASAGTRRDIARARLLDALNVGLIGYGGIGQEVARRLRALGVTVRAFSPSRLAGGSEDGVTFTTLDDLLATSDVVSLHAALTPRSRHILDRGRMARLKPGALVVNTARGGLIDEDALADALASGAVAGAALDCFEHEPLPRNSPLWNAPNTILTPHQIGHTADGARSVVDAFVANILSFVRVSRLQELTQ